MLGIQDFTRLWYGIQRSPKYLDRTWDLTAPLEVETEKFGQGIQELCCNCWDSEIRYDPNLNVFAVIANQPSKH